MVNQLADASSFFGSLWFGLMLALTGLIGGFVWCKRSAERK